MRPYAANLNTGAGPYSGLNVIKVVSLFLCFRGAKVVGSFETCILKGAFFYQL